jgi:hypothetical protein
LTIFIRKYNTRFPTLGKVARVSRRDFIAIWKRASGDGVYDTCRVCGSREGCCCGLLSEREGERGREREDGIHNTGRI